MRLATDYLCMDEPALNLSEVNLMAPDNSAFHRFQVITVVREDKPADHYLDMGVANSFTREQFRIPGGVIDWDTGEMWIEHSVGELKDIADYIREHPVVEEGELIKTDLIQGYHDEMEARPQRRKGRKVFTKEV